MYQDLLRALKTKLQQHSSDEGTRRSHKFRPARLDALEDRRLLSVGPTIFTVTDTSDLATDAGSLESAVEQARASPNPAGSLIEFSKSVFSTPQTITLSTTLEIGGSAGPIMIAGPGASLLTISGNNAVRVFEVDFDATAVLSDMTISGGTTSRHGGGVLNGGTLTILNSVIENNTIDTDPPARNGVQHDTIVIDRAAGGGVFNDGVMTISGCTIGSNELIGSGANGAGIFNENLMTISHSTITSNTVNGPVGEGGGLYNDSVIAISDSAITNNTVIDATGQGGGIFNDGNMTLASSTVQGNSVDGSNGEGGGCFNEENLTAIGCTFAMNSATAGGGIFNEQILTISNSTVAGNSAGTKGGGIFNDDFLTAVNTTIADNSAGTALGGGGLSVSAQMTANLNNTIVAGNTFGTVPDDVDGTLSTTSAFNLIGTGGAGGLTNGVNGNLVGVANPGLGTLANNGGSTATIALLPGSPAVDAGSNALDGLANDQRGPGLVRTFGASIDIGAFELQPATVTSVSVDWGSVGTAALQTAADGLRLLPAGRNLDLPWSGINKLQVTFSEPENLTASDATITSARGVNYGPVTITGSGESFTITLAQPILKADRVTIVMANAGIAQFVHRLDVLPGDVNDNGAVNKADVQEVRSASTGATPAAVFADVLGSGTVGATDVKAVKKLMGKSLPKLRHVPKVALGEAFMREHQPMRRHHH
jgi:hypothetical protein